MNETQRRRYEALRADRQVVDQAARWLRHEATQQQYAGFQRQEIAYTVAAVFDTLSRHLDAVPDAVRMDVLRAADTLAAAPWAPGGIGPDGRPAIH